MTRLTFSLLTRLRNGSGSEVSSASTLESLREAAKAVSDGCSTNFTSLTCGPSRLCAGTYFQARRFKYAHSLVRPIDTNQINALLNSSTRVEHAALQVLRYGEWFDPEQVTRTLQRVPRMLSYQRRKNFQAPADVTNRLLDVLGQRLAQVAPDCSDDQLARALWAYGASRRCPEPVAAAACEQLPARLSSMAPPQLATAAWGLAAAAVRGGASAEVQQSVRSVLQTIARHLAQQLPTSRDQLHLAATSPPPTSAPGAASFPPAAPAVDASSDGTLQLPRGVLAMGTSSSAAAAGAAAVEAVSRPWLDHRSALKLAWAFAAAGVKDSEALEVIGNAAAAQIVSQLASHSGASGPLTPRATYLYRCIEGWQARPSPRTPRPNGAHSAYLRDERPRVVLRDFTLTTLAPLMAAFKRLGHRHKELLQASTRHVLASAGPGLRVAPSDLTRLLGAWGAFRHRNPYALSALLTATQLSDLPAPVLLRLTVMAAEWGVGSRALYRRLVNQLQARVWITDGSRTEGGEGAPSRLGNNKSRVEGEGAGALSLVEAGETGLATTSAAAGSVGGEDAAEKEAAAVAAANEPPVLDPAARESWEERMMVSGGGGARRRGAVTSWRVSGQQLEQEAAAWEAASRDPRDGCSAGEVVRLLVGLAEVGSKRPDVPSVGPLFAALTPHLARIQRDAAADVALAAALFKPQLDALSTDTQGAPMALDLIRDATNVVLFGSPTANRDMSERWKRLLRLAGYGETSRGFFGGSGEGPAAADSEDAAAAQLRSELGLSARGALRLARALSLAPNAFTEADKQLRVALSLMDASAARKEELDAIIRRFQERALGQALPPRMLAAAAALEKASLG